MPFHHVLASNDSLRSIFHPLSKYPSPFLARISRTWLFIQILSGNVEKTQRTLHQKYGPIIRITPNEVPIANPESVKTTYAVKSGFTKTGFYTPFKPDFCIYPDHFTNLDEKVHVERRKIVNNLYSMSNIIRSEEYIDIRSEALMSRIGEFAERGSGHFELPQCPLQRGNQAVIPEHMLQ